MPMASTKSGNAMMVSVTRVTSRSVQPPKKPGARARALPIANDSATADDRDHEVEARRHDHPAQDVAAELVGAEPVRARRRLAAPRAVLLASGS